MTGVESLVTPELTRENVELVDLTYQKGPAGWTLCFYIDKPGGVTLDDCATWSHRFEQILDGTDLMSHAYSLEVSSPGIDRPIKKVSDYQKFAGQRVHVKLYAPQNGQKNFHGTLLGSDGTTVRLKEEGKTEIDIPLSLVARTRLDPVIDF